MKFYAALFFALRTILLGVEFCSASDITPTVFWNTTTSMPAAFGDFNSDKLTDIFMIREDGKTLDIFLAQEQDEPLMRTTNLSCSFKNLMLTSVVPGDFDGDTMMDVLVTSINKSDNIHRGMSLVHIMWGGLNYLICSDENQPILMVKDQPLALDFNQDMITDLFGINSNGNRSFWIFSSDRSPPKEEIVSRPEEPELRHPQSHAYLDLNGDYVSDMLLTSVHEFEVWYGDKEEGFHFNHSVAYPPGVNQDRVGQSLFLDVELRNELLHLIPVCFDDSCHNSSLAVYGKEKWTILPLNLKDPQGNVWGFAKQPGRKYTDVVTLRAGDFNLDGYPDLLATLQSLDGKLIKTYLLENIECMHCEFSRSYAVQWGALGAANNTVMGAFFDFYQNGLLDVILVQRNDDGKHFQTIVFKNDLDYDANFIKVMVLTGLTPAPAVGKIPYGTNLPGPRVSYFTVTQDGQRRYGCAAQLQQSAHFPLQLPFSIFGLGRTPNFVDKLITGLAGQTKDWLLVIPNSQMVVVPSPKDNPAHWKVQLFVTPGKTILETMVVLLGTCALIVMIIGALHFKEKREDRLAKLQEAHRFHFDAM